MPDDTVAVADPAISVFSIPEGIPAQDEPVEATPDQQEPVEEAAPGTDVLPDAETEPERPDLSALLKGISDDDLENLPEVKSLVARKGESARQKAEREATAKLEAANQRYLASGEAFNDLQRMIASAANNLDYNGLPVVDRNQVNRLFNTMCCGHRTSSTRPRCSVHGFPPCCGRTRRRSKAMCASAWSARYVRSTRRRRSWTRRRPRPTRASLSREQRWFRAVCPVEQPAPRWNKPQRRSAQADVRRSSGSFRVSPSRKETRSCHPA